MTRDVASFEDAHTIRVRSFGLGILEDAHTIVPSPLGEGLCHVRCRVGGRDY